MIELEHDQLVFRFPQVHPDAVLRISFQRTLRIPDDGKDYPLPPGLGRFPVRAVDDHANAVPPRWRAHGGVMLPLYQSEALWIHFESQYVPLHSTSYPFAVKVAAGKINAVTGQPWANDLNERPQDYLVVPTQPWIDGYAVDKGVIRQFVAMPLGSGYSAEEQITGTAEHGGLQLMVFPMRRDRFERRFPCRPAKTKAFHELCSPCAAGVAMADMALAPGGRMKQEIYDDPFDFEDWDRTVFSRCFVHLANSLIWRAITGEAPPTTPLTARQYTRAGLPWFDYYSENAALEGSEALAELKSILQMAAAKGDVPLPENESVEPETIKVLGDKRPGRVRECSW